jgi:excisionase family DNA binding protein
VGVLALTWQARELGINLDALKREAHSIDDDWLGTAVAANRYHVSTQTIYRYVEAGKLAARKQGGRLWVSETDLKRHLG